MSGCLPGPQPQHSRFTTLDRRSRGSHSQPTQDKDGRFLSEPAARCSRNQTAASTCASSISLLKPASNWPCLIPPQHRPLCPPFPLRRFESFPFTPSLSSLHALSSLSSFSSVIELSCRLSPSTFGYLPFGANQTGRMTPWQLKFLL